MSKISPLREQLQYMYGLERFGIRMGLEVMQALLEGLGHPERAYKTVHITGTNGKGSTAAFLDSILRESGLKVGLYTSPHLVRFNERIQMNGIQISHEELIALIEEVRTVIGTQHIQATFFEFTTAVAFLYFAREKVDIAVIEVGMGGLLDATNVINPLVAIITNIGNDHIPMIGRNTQEIAENKAGIIKTNSIVVTAETNPAFIEYFKKVCDEKNAQLHVVQREFSVIPVSPVVTPDLIRGPDSQILDPGLRRDDTSQSFALSGTITGAFTIPLLGAHQITNASTALLTFRLLSSLSHPVRDTGSILGIMQRGLSKTIWPGRLDIVSQKPFILVDGAHNDDGIKVLAEFLHTTTLPKKKVLVLAVKKGKDLQEMLTRIIPLFERIIITQGTYEPEDTSVIAMHVKKVTTNYQEIPDAKIAIEAGKKLLAEGDMMLVTGSLYMIGAAL